MLKPNDFLNKMILVGITILRPNGEKEFIQTHGIVKHVDGNYLYLKKENEELFYLGYSIQAFSIAQPGIYRAYYWN
jgi:hypothetical protein